MKYKSLVSEIEAYLKSLLHSSPEGQIEVRRKEIAELFDCVPSQITYVINTRFSVGHGYLVESRRGGGGYIRISNLFDVPEKAPASVPVPEETVEDARKVLNALAQRGVFTRREFLILSTTLKTLESELSGNRGGKLFLQILKELAAESFF
jgi:transcriptional regulator CtsR